MAKKPIPKWKLKRFKNNICKGDIYLVRTALSATPLLANTEFADGSFPLLVAVKHGRAECAQALIDAQGDIHRRTKEGQLSLLEVAAKYLIKSLSEHRQGRRMSRSAVDIPQYYEVTKVLLVSGVSPFYGGDEDFISKSKKHKILFDAMIPVLEEIKELFLASKSCIQKLLFDYCWTDLEVDCVLSFLYGYESDDIDNMLTESSLHTDDGEEEMRRYMHQIRRSQFQTTDDYHKLEF